MSNGFSKTNIFQQTLFQAPSLMYTTHQVMIANVPVGNNPFFDLDFVIIERQIGQPRWASRLYEISTHSLVAEVIKPFN
jgi:hypothetical protein